MVSDHDDAGSSLHALVAERSFRVRHSGSNVSKRDRLTMVAFLDFEASSLSRHSYPIEVGWIFANGDKETHLIRPATGWDDWDEASAAIHGIDRAALERDGTPHDEVALRMVEALSDHDIGASAPSWDGKWLSRLLRAAGFPRHRLRLRATEDILVETAAAILAGAPAIADPDGAARALAEAARARSRTMAPRHRALAEAVEERRQWVAVRSAAEAMRVGGPDAMAASLDRQILGLEGRYHDFPTPAEI